MSCFLCGHEDKNSHHLGCMVAATPSLTPEMAVRLGFMAPPPGEVVVPEPIVEVLREGTLSTVPVASGCEFGDCDNPKYSDSPRAKYCEDHKDPKNRKE